MNQEMKEILLKLAHHLGIWNVKIDLAGENLRIINMRNNDSIELAQLCDSDSIFNLIHPK